MILRCVVLAFGLLVAATLGVTAYQDARRPPFATWLVDVRRDALAEGIRGEVFDQAFAGINSPLSVVVERDQSQAETALTLDAYVQRRVSRSAIRKGRQLMAQHRAILDQVASRYGVPASIVVAIWGMESNFGRFSGAYPVVHALATLAWEGRREALFRRELMHALEILNRGEVDPAKLKGSWAGAMGQPQFMPSSYATYAEDFDGDGRRDIWDSPADVFASIGNYLRGYGWVTGYRWGREVRVTREASERIAAEVPRRDGSCTARRDMSAPLPLPDWHRLGVTVVTGARLPRAAQTASLVSGPSRHFLVYDNYDVLLDYNCAHAYAISVALLADQISKQDP